MSVTHHTIQDGPRWGRLSRALLAAGLILLLAGSMLSLAVAKNRPAAAPTDYQIRYTIDRASLPPLYYNAVTLVIDVGSAESVSAAAGGQPIAVIHNRASRTATVTTAAGQFDLTVRQAEASFAIGSFRRAALKDDRQWAWSHSFDDNTGFTKYGVQAFDSYGWRATVYLIGSKIDDTRDEDWILDRPGIVRLFQKGWGIGNHGWTHATVSSLGQAAAREEILLLDNSLRGMADEAGQPYTRLTAFAAPLFDSAYHPILQNIKAQGAANLLFNESGSSGFMRVDVGASERAYSSYAVFAPSDMIGRDYRIEKYGDGGADDRAFQADVQAMLGSLDGEHHYWLNTFTHDVDDDYPNKSIFAFLPWLYDHSGPGGDDSVWVAPAEEIYSYLLVRDHAVIRYTSTGGGVIHTATPVPVPTQTPTPVRDRFQYIPWFFELAR